MKLQLIKQIVGIRDRGLPTESRIVYAEEGDRVTVLFDNTSETFDNETIGHYICGNNDNYFVVFLNQFDLIIREKGEYKSLTTEDDILYSKSAEDFEDTILE
jgi:hypothetical protein